jgi:hypothetical protein
MSIFRKTKAARLMPWLIFPIFQKEVGMLMAE